MKNNERAQDIIKRLEKAYPDVDGTPLNYSSPLELLIATILSAQSTDKQINKITEALFKKYKTAAEYANSPLDELKNDIRSSGFFNRKAVAIHEATKKIVEDYDGQVPNTMKDLVKLKGVARKTANIVLSGAFSKTVGIAVDTHVRRLALRLGLTENADPAKIEVDLMKLTPKAKWVRITDLLIFHGRRVCHAKKPKCDVCVLTKLCPSAFTFNIKSS